jgi:hypothetical protein
VSSLQQFVLRSPVTPDSLIRGSKAEEPKSRCITGTLASRAAAPAAFGLLHEAGDLAPRRAPVLLPLYFPNARGSRPRNS